MPTRIAASLLVALIFALAFADPPKPSPAPDLGPEKYTIHASGTLRDMIDALGKLAHRQIWLTPAPPGAPPTQPPDQTPVALNFDNATLGDILASLCKQAGIVYESQQGSWGSQYPPIILRPGDPAVDGRPVCVLDDYILRLIMISASQSRSATFRWGAATPERPDPQSQLQVTLEVLPRTPEADVTSESPECQAVRQEEHERLLAGIAELPEDLRAVVSLRAVEELGFAEIGEIVGATEGACRVRYHRARELLKAALGAPAQAAKETA
jgi:RNA polymerase sigma factor (sigma-70 family)